MRLATGGGVVLADRRPGDPPLPPDLASALREWAEVASTVRDVGSSAEQELVRRRGRQLAARVAGVLGRPVDFVDPVTGAAEPVPAADAPARARHSHRHARWVEGGVSPTPWGTGLPIAAFFAVLVAIADVVLSRAFAEAFGLLWVPANLLVGAGLAPSLWLLRRTPFWRWPAGGVAAGLLAAWVVLLLGMLG